MFCGRGCDITDVDDVGLRQRSFCDVIKMGVPVCWRNGGGGSWQFSVWTKYRAPGRSTGRRGYDQFRRLVQNTPYPCSSQFETQENGSRSQKSLREFPVIIFERTERLDAYTMSSLLFVYSVFINIVG